MSFGIALGIIGSRVLVNALGWPMSISAGTIAEELRRALDRTRRDELERGLTLVGPHRDDFVFLLGGRPVALYGSRGEWRRGMLSYQFAELLYLESLGKQPLLLLDDAFSELDESHRLELSDAILERNVLLTTTEVGILSDKLKKSAKIITISK